LAKLLLCLCVSAILYKFAKWCASDRKKLRPEMEEVYLKLKSSLRKERAFLKTNIFLPVER
jgi:hypothetical protein